jgi:glycerophosphoryl diester phosphodiesterase
LAAFAAALDAGADAIELDVHATRDGVVVVHHDAELSYGGSKRPAEDPARIAALPFSRIAEARLTDGSRIPTLDDVLSLVAGRAHVHVEIKGRAIEQMVMDCIIRSRADASVHSFDHRIVRKCAALNQKVRRGILLGSYLIDTAAALRNADASDVWQSSEFIDRALVDTVHDAGGRLIAWTVNNVVEAAELRALGVDAICTDRVAEMRRE